MSDLVPADATHVFTAFVEAFTQQINCKHPGDASVAALVADRVLEILGMNGLMVMQAPGVPA